LTLGSTLWITRNKNFNRCNLW